MSLLKATKPEVIKRQKPKVVIFGKAGIGKTWGAINFPSVYFIDIEGGATEGQYVEKLVSSGGVYLGKEHGSQNFETVISQLKGLATEKHEYKTVVIDSFTKLFDIAVADEVERLTAARKEIAYGNEKKPAVKLAKRLIGWIDKLDMNVILICHSKAKYEMIGGENKQTGNTFDGYEKLDYELQLCLEISKQGNTRKAFIHKTRIAEFPESNSFDWSYDSFRDRLGKELLESEAKTIVLATPEQIVEFNRLIRLVRLGDSVEDKAIMEITPLIEETETEKVARIINYLTKKVK